MVNRVLDFCFSYLITATVFFQFCGPCLRNRYGEDAREALKNKVRFSNTRDPHGVFTIKYRTDITLLARPPYTIRSVLINKLAKKKFCICNSDSRKPDDRGGP